jgi:hypothetical protein
MAATTRTVDVQVLLDRPGGPGMVVSGYADMTVAEGFEPRWRAQFKAEAGRVRGRLAGDPEGLRAFDDLFESVVKTLEFPEDREAHGLAVFAASGEGPALAVPFDEPFENQLVVDEEPYLVPFVAADRRRREYLVVLTNTHRGRLYEATPGRVRLLEEIDETALTKEHPAGERGVKQQDTISRHRENQILRYQKGLARLVEKAWEARPRDGVLLLGEHEVLQHLLALLPKRLAERVVREAPRSWEDEKQAILEEVRCAAEASVRAKEEALLAEVERRLREGFAVASGPQEVLDALKNGQAATILLGPDAGEVASRCSGCGSSFASEVPACPYCGSSCSRTNLWQEILRPAVRHGVAVHFVKTAPGRDVPGGVSVLLTRDEPQWTRTADQADRPGPNPSAIS